MVGAGKSESTSARRGYERRRQGTAETTRRTGVPLKEKGQGEEPETSRARGFGKRRGKSGDQFWRTMSRANVWRMSGDNEISHFRIF